jgi:hypothetical protein
MCVCVGAHTRAGTCVCVGKCVCARARVRVRVRACVRACECVNRWVVVYWCVCVCVCAGVFECVQVRTCVEDPQPSAREHTGIRGQRTSERFRRASVPGNLWRAMHIERAAVTGDDLAPESWELNLLWVSEKNDLCFVLVRHQLGTYLESSLMNENVAC